ncbi:MAG: acetolactate synthase large subunit, partial [Nitrospinae bacterium]|nr:acetolactate synthase large subunit [Nitrospinota bacterium]
TYASNIAIQESDLLISLGARFDDRVTGTISTFAPKAKVVHIDIDPTAIGKNVKVDTPIVGDIKVILRNLNKSILENFKGKKIDLKAWHKKLEGHMKKQPLKYDDVEGEIKPQYVVEELCTQTKGEAIVATEVGQAQMWAAQFYKFVKNRSFLTSGGLGTMGYGFPAAMGAKLAYPSRTVINIAGDGSIQMNIQEMATCIQYDVPVINAILNNGYLGMVRQWQQLFFNRRYSNSDMFPGQPDFVKLAEAYGGVGYRVTDKRDVASVIKEAIKVKKPVLIDFRVSREENVYPMVPAGKAINDMLLS